MNNDITRLRQTSGKLVEKQEWIIQTLRALNAQDPENIGLNEKHFEVLAA